MSFIMDGCHRLEETKKDEKRNLTRAVANWVFTQTTHIVGLK